MRGLSIDARYRVVRNIAIGDPAVTQWATYNCTSTAQPGYQMLTNFTGSDKGIRFKPAPLNLGMTAYMYAEVRVPGAGANTIMFRSRLSGDIQRFGSDIIISDDGQWHSLAQTPLTFTAAEASTMIEFRPCEMKAGQAWYPTEVDVRGACIFDAPVTRSLYGDSPSWRWDGTPNASTSRGLVFVP